MTLCFLQWSLWSQVLCLLLSGKLPRWNIHPHTLWSRIPCLGAQESQLRSHLHLMVSLNSPLGSLAVWMGGSVWQFAVWWPQDAFLHWTTMCPWEVCGISPPNRCSAVSFRNIVWSQVLLLGFSLDTIANWSSDNEAVQITWINILIFCTCDSTYFSVASITIATVFHQALDYYSYIIYFIVY